jgi:hypothetical protein
VVEEPTQQFEDDGFEDHEPLDQMDMQPVSESTIAVDSASMMDDDRRQGRRPVSCYFMYLRCSLCARWVSVSFAGVGVGAATAKRPTGVTVGDALGRVHARVSHDMHAHIHTRPRTYIHTHSTTTD